MWGVRIKWFSPQIPAFIYEDIGISKIFLIRVPILLSHTGLQEKKTLYSLTLYKCRMLATDKLENQICPFPLYPQDTISFCFYWISKFKHIDIH